MQYLSIQKYRRSLSNRGAFTQGSSIELSADGPLRPPYTAYLQGGLTYESGKYAIMRAADAMLAAQK